MRTVGKFLENELRTTKEYFFCVNLFVSSAAGTMLNLQEVANAATKLERRAFDKKKKNRSKRQRERGNCLKAKENKKEKNMESFETRKRTKWAGHIRPRKPSNPVATAAVPTNPFQKNQSWTCVCQDINERRIPCCGWRFKIGRQTCQFIRRKRTPKKWVEKNG